MKLRRFVRTATLTGAALAAPLWLAATVRAQNCGIGTSYCAATTNSTGQAASLVINGSAAGGAGGALSLAASGIPNSAGLFFHGSSAVAVPFGNGLRCVGGSTQRTPISLASSGAASWTLATDAFAPGSTRRFQYWFRDVLAAPGFSNFSDAVAVTFTGGGCDHMGLNVVSPSSAAEGDLLQASGAGLGSDPDDLCVMLVSGGDISFARAQSANGVGLSLSVEAIAPGMTAGQVQVMRGDGVRGALSGLPPGIVQVGDAWTWRGQAGNAMALASTPVALTGGPAPAAGPLGSGPCNSVWGTLASDGTVRIKIPGGATCPAGAQLQVRFEGRYGGAGWVGWEMQQALQTTAPLGTCECATRLCAAIQAAFFQQHGVLLPCSTTPLGPCNTNPDVELTFVPPNFGVWDAAFVQIRICP